MFGWVSDKICRVSDDLFKRFVVDKISFSIHVSAEFAESKFLMFLLSKLEGLSFFVKY